MVTFGFSAFLKLLSMNDRPRYTELRRRLTSDGNGYDFHRSFRLHARRLLAGAPIGDVIASASRITKPSERNSAVTALQRLDLWQHEMVIEMFVYGSVDFESPRKLFKVRFEPDFCACLRGRRTAFHLWNTKTPLLAPGPTYAALSLVSAAYQDHGGAPDDVAVLSVREPPSVYPLSAAPNMSRLAATIVWQLEDAIKGGAGVPLSPPEDRPPI